MRSRPSQNPHSNAFSSIERGSDVWWVEPPRPDYMQQVSRDARSVLAAMVSNIDWLRSMLEPSGLSHDVSAGLMDIEACCERLTGLFDDALVAVRPDGLEPRLAPVSVGTLTASVLQRLTKRMAIAGVHVGHDGDTTTTVMLDRSLIARVIERLLERTIEDMPGSQLSLFHASDGNNLTLSLIVRACRCSAIAGATAGAVGCSCLENMTERGDSEFCETILHAHGGAVAFRPAANVRWALLVPVVPRRHPGRP